MDLNIPQRVPRPAARIILLDRSGRALLFRFDPPGRPPFWCTPGGALDPGESFEQAARRELREETGLVVDVGVEIARRVVEFETIEGVHVHADERYFLVRLDCDRPELDTSAHTALELSVMRSWDWFDPAALARLDELHYPEDLFAMAAV